MPGLVSFEIRGGEIVDPHDTFVYCWCDPQAGDAAVIYVGATRLHPAARAEKHLRDPDPDLGRVRTRYTAIGGDLTQPLTVHAVAIGPGDRRAVVKAHVAWRLHESKRLAPLYCGDPPTQPDDTLSPSEDACAQALIAAVAGAAR